MCHVIFDHFGYRIFTVVFEGIKKEKWAHTIHKYIMPFVIIGVGRSTLHQSSLGSLLLIQPSKLHPLWWTPTLPILFFISALAIGMGMIIFESTLSSRFFKRGLESHLLEKLAKAIPAILVSYCALKIGEIVWAGDIKNLFSGSWMSILFWAEVLISTIIPIIWFSIKRLRQNPNALFIGAIILLIGMIFNRFNVSWFAVQHPDPIT